MLQRQLTQIVTNFKGQFAGNEGALIPKLTGDPISAAVSFVHVGDADIAYISWWLAPGSDVPLLYYWDNGVAVVYRTPVQVVSTPTPLTYNLTLQALFPDTSGWPWEGVVIVKEEVDCLIRIESSYGGPMVIAEQLEFNDIYDAELAALGPEFRNLDAVFA